MRTRISSILLVLLGLAATPLCSQLKLSERSGLSNPEYLEHKIRSISDEEFFGALQLDLPRLGGVKNALQKNSMQAYRAWAKYWESKEQPKYASLTDHLLIDTDMLEGYDQIRSTIARHPEERDTILAKASLLLRNIIRPWGDVVVDFGARVDFNREIGQSGKYGFHYWIWSKPLILAYIITGDQKYLAKFDELFQQWYVQRNSIARSIPDFDVVYYELGLGVRNRMFIEYYFLPYQQRTWQTHERMLKTILAAGRWLYQLELWEGYRSGNWQIHGSYMLAQIALVFPEFKESKEWLKVALQRLQEHLHQDFFEDGGHSERAPRNYTQATYLNYRNLYFLLSTYHVQKDLAEEIHQRMGNTIDWWITMLAPTGEIPAINDSQRGLFPTFILQDGASFYHKPYVYGILKNLFGVGSTDTALVLPAFTSRHMPASGFSVMRSDWSRNALYLNVNYGKWNGSHTHNDMLDFELYAYGRALAVDAGIGLTYDDPLYIPWYKSSRAHNMVTVNDLTMEREKVEGENILWSSGSMLDYFAGEHRGYEKLGVHHRRQIVFVKPSYWVVLDDLKCEKGGDTLSWYFHTPMNLHREGGQYESTSTPGNLVLPIVGASSSRTGRCTAASTIDLTPGKTEEITWLSFDQISSADSTSQFRVLLYPFKESAPSVTGLALSNTHTRVSGSGFTDDLYSSSVPFDDGEIASDAAFLLVHKSEGMAERVSLVRGTYLRVHGREVWRSTTPASVEQVISR